MCANSSVSVYNVVLWDELHVIQKTARRAAHPKPILIGGGLRIWPQQKSVLIKLCIDVQELA